MISRRERQLGAFGVAAGGLALAVAHASEVWGQQIPCELCLIERWPYRFVILLGIAALLLPRRDARPALWAMVAVLLAGAGLAFLHVGVEQGWWQSPFPSCRSPDLHGMSVGERLAHLPATPSKPCDQADYPFPGVPVTFAEADLIYALAVGGALATALARVRPRRVR